MSIKGRLARALGRRDEAPNIELAEVIAAAQDQKAVRELAGLIATGSKPQRHDAIKVLYEIGARDAALIVPETDRVLECLGTRDNRMIWGVLSVLDAIKTDIPERLMGHLVQILAAADRSSVIANDRLMSILSHLNGITDFRPVIEPVLLQRLSQAAVNQFPMYAEMAAESMSAEGLPAFRDILQRRHEDISYPAKKARIAKVLRKVSAA